MATLQQRLADLITAIGTDYKSIWANTGNKVNLSTTVKTDLVAAINEVNSKPSGTGGATIADGDPGTSTTTTYSAKKINDDNVAQNTAIAGKAATTHTHTTAQVTGLDTALAGKQATGTAVLLTTAQSIDGVKTFTSAPVVPDGAFVFAKVNGLQTALDGKPGINDAALATSTTAAGGVWSPARVTTAISALETKLVGGAGTAFDTFKELEALMLADDTETSGIVTALGQRLRVDVANQGLTLTQQQNGRTNLNAYGSIEIGNPDTDLVALYTTAKA